MKKMYLPLIAFLLAGCSSFDHPHMNPMSEEEKSSFTCEDIQKDTALTRLTLAELQSTKRNVADGASIGLATAFAALGAIDFELIGAPIVRVNAVGKTNKRLQQLLELSEQKECAEILLIDEETPPTEETTLDLDEEATQDNISSKAEEDTDANLFGNEQ